MKRFLIFFFVVISAVFVSCSKEEAKKLLLDKTSTSLYQNETSVITSNGTNVTYTSRNPYVATVKETGEVTAHFVGETVIDVKADEGTAEFKVTVTPKYYTFDEPCHDWTKTKNEVFAMHPSLSFSSSGEYWIATVNESKAMLLQYKFDSANKLESSAITIHQDYGVQAMYFLAERYFPVTKKDGYYFFINGLSTTTANTSIAMSKMPGYTVYMIMYMPYSSSKSVVLSDSGASSIILPEAWKE